MSQTSRPLLTGLLFVIGIVALAEFFALFFEYQNSAYYRQYIANNTTLILEQILALVIIVAVAGFFVYRATSAKTTSRLGRFSNKISGFAPLIVGLIAVVLYFTLFTTVIGDSTIYLELYIVAVVFLITIGLMARDKITVRMALRNFTRRKTSMAIVIAGLMIGTAMISGSLVTGDTLSELFTRSGYYGYGYADEVVYVPSQTGYQFFPINTATQLQQGIADNPSAAPYLRGVTPEILTSLSVNDTTKNIVQSPVQLIGSFNNASQVLGDFHAATGGQVIGSNMRDSEAILNDRAARDLNATTGDILTIFSPYDASVSVSVSLLGIAASDARGYFGAGDNIWVTMFTAQALTAHPGAANFIAITNTGGLRPSIQHTSTVGLAANQTLNNIQNPPSGFACKSTASSQGNSTNVLCAYGAKQTAVNNATTGAKQLSNLFLVLSIVTIIAGVVLIINMFIMLAEERKSEMGMGRAVGMKRSQLTKLFLYEGSVYAAGAALLGVFVGIAIAYVILYAFGTILSSVFPVSLAVVLDSFTFSPTSLLTSFTSGLLITYFTILFTSWRVSKLNIIRAIRDIPEPPRGVRTYTVLLGLGLVLAAIGSLIFLAAGPAKSALETLLGPTFIIMGIGLVLSRFLKNRIAFTLTGIAIVLQWGIPSLSWNNPAIQNYTFGPELFIAGGLIMVVGAVMAVMYNTGSIQRLFKLFYSRSKGLTAIFKMALSYPGNKKFRTAATVAMFALVLFTVVTIAFLAAMQTAALDTYVKQNSGGYDIITSTQLAVPDLRARVNNDPSLNSKIVGVLPFNTTAVIAKDLTLKRDFGNPYVSLVGADANAVGPNNFFTTNTFKMVNMTSNYKTAADVWNAVTTDSSKIVWSFGFVNVRGPPTQSSTPNPGDVMQIIGQSPTGSVSRQVTVAGLMNGVFFDGIITTSQALQSTFGVGTGQLGFVKVASGFDPVVVANGLKHDFARLGMQTTVIGVVLGQFIQVGQSFLGIFEGFLALGLVVGIAGLGIIAIRSVVERRKEIGILRAIGFRKRMILASFLLENSYVALLGIIIGVVLGIDLGYAIATSPNSGLIFTIPWLSLLEIIAFAYGLSLLTTVGSARRAARVPPAEALRYSE
ncbi:MAG TPA: FtsX-like permease family protein [Candidatus Bathyarchaeia archaeon]|nr:FtsX-like permease family protein [Candidatus Bathyarchaeia archaeon]